jgi:malonate-semialdehyde dehydrogenase (acetylating)/methylmalonate-semialdehyde dehydrogenase
MRTIDHWIGGRLVAGADEGRDPVYDPATGEQTAQVGLAGAGLVGESVAVARAASGPWQDTSLARRAKVLFAFRDLVDRHRDDLARLVTAEHGKTLDDARGEVQRGLEVVEFACGVPYLIRGDYSDAVSTNVDAHSLRQPIGVAAGITPFNFPVMVPMWMYPLAIACGNTFVLKPSEKDPSSSLLVAQLWAEAGLPAGVFNVVQGGKAAVDAILDHPGIASVSFVGSTPIARYVYERGTAHAKRVQALGGAKNHMVVLPDANVGVAADAAVSAGYGSAGERCMAISAVVAVGGVADQLVEAIRQRTVKVVTGAGADEGVDMGPLVTKAHRDKVASYIDEGIKAGAKLVVDGRGCHVPGHDTGFFLGPCLFDQVTTDMTVYTEEIFGPVLSVLRVDNYDEALALVNANPYGNGVALFTNDGLASRRFQREVEVGMVGINVPIPTPMPYYSFGGWKQSLFGDTHMYGMHGVHFYTRTKAVTVRWPEPDGQRAVSLGFPVAQ